MQGVVPRRRPYDEVMTSENTQRDGAVLRGKAPLVTARLSMRETVARSGPAPQESPRLP